VEGIETHDKEIKEIESAYELRKRRKIHAILLEKYLKESIQLSSLIITRSKQFKIILTQGDKLNKKSLPADAELFFKSFESLTSRLMKFIKLLEQITTLILDSEKEFFYSEARTYGRGMSEREYKQTVKEKKLCSQKDPTYVFDATPAAIELIRNMKKDEKKNYFASIGVMEFSRVLIFKTRQKPLNYNNPIPQSNRLRQYNFPAGMSISFLEAA